MSTKTTLKRVALVAVSALGFGLLSVAPSQAVVANPGSSIFTPTTYKAITSTPTQHPYNWTITQDAGPSNFVGFTANLNVADQQLDGVRAVVSGGTLRTAGGASALCTSTTLASVGISTTYASGRWGASTAAADVYVTTTEALTSNVATITTAAAHGFAVGDTVVVAAHGAPFDGTKVVTAVTATTFSFAETAADVVSNADPGTVTITRKATRLLATDVVGPLTTGATSCVGNLGAAYDGIALNAPAFFTVGTPTAGTITVMIYGDEINSGALTSTLLQTMTINVLPVASIVYTSAKTTQDAVALNGGYYNPYEGVYAPKTANGNPVGKLTVAQYAGSALVTTQTELKTITVTMSGAAGSLDPVAPGASFFIYSNTIGNLDNNEVINIYPDGRGGEATVTVSVNGVVNSVTKWWFYGQAASVTASAVLGVGRASSTGNRVTGGLKYIDYGTCVLGTEAGCNTAVAAGATVGSATSPEDPAELNNVAIAVLVKDANGIPVPTPVTGTSSNALVVSDARYSWLLDSGASDYSAGTYYQHITYQTPINSVSGSTANLTYSVLNPDGTVITSNAVAVKLGGAPLSANVKMTTDKSSYMPGEAGVITITATDSLGNTPYDGSAPFTKVEANTALFTGKIPTTATVLTNGTATTKFFAPAVPGKWTITATLGDGVTTLTLPVTVGADTSAIDAAADAAAEAIDAANAATDAANLAAEAADAATVAAEEARDAADAATAAVEELATEVAALFAALKAQLTTLANTVAKIAKKVKA